MTKSKITLVLCFIAFLREVFSKLVRFLKKDENTYCGGSSNSIALALGHSVLPDKLSLVVEGYLPVPWVPLVHSWVPEGQMRP